MKLYVFVLTVIMASCSLSHFVLTNGTKKTENEEGISIHSNIGKGELIRNTVVKEDELTMAIEEKVPLVSRYRRQLFPVPNNYSSKVGKQQDLTCPASLSCKNNCSTPRYVVYSGKMSCFCDKECVFFKDCCADAEHYCSSDKKSQRVQQGLLTNQNKELWDCYEGKTVFGTAGIWMIGSCPESWKGSDIFYKCRNLSVTNQITKDNYGYLPVYTNNGTVYHNRFCAQCNGIKSIELMEYDLAVDCSVTPMASYNRKEQIEFLLMHCDKNLINWSAPPRAPRRHCIYFREPDISCKDDTDGKCLNGSTGVVFASSNFANYRNKHCAALCGQKIDCGPLANSQSWFTQTKPFSLIFDFQDNSQRKGSLTAYCPLASPFYDPHLEICRKGRSPTPMFVKSKSQLEYEVILWMYSQVPTNFQFRFALRRSHINSSTLENILEIDQNTLSNLKISILSSTLFRFQMKLNISSMDCNKTSFGRRRRSLPPSGNHYIERLINFKTSFDLSVMTVNFTVFKVTKRILGCMTLQKYWRHEYTVIAGDRQAVVITKTKELLTPNEFYTLNDTSPNNSQAIFVCRTHHNLNCSEKWVLMDEGEFIVLGNKTVFVNSSKHCFDESRYIWENRSVLVCENFSTVYQDKRQVPRNPLDHLLNLTYVCMVVSIVALIFVLVTYSLFSELRTQPGINLMNLSVSILLAQLLWLLGVGKTDHPTFCTVVAVLLHYLFLVSFVWTLIIAFDTWRAFTAHKRCPTGESKRKKLIHSLRYMVVGWLSVMVYVAICVVLDFTNTVSIGYKNDKKVCWINDRLSNWYFFAIPIAFILTFNTLFFALTAKAIKTSSSQARVATDRRDGQQTFGIYVRIASVMGFTWILGFIAPFVPGFLWYLFIIFNGLQGLYIAIAFALNQRARNLYNNRFPFLSRITKTSVNPHWSKTISKSDKISDDKQFMDTKL